VGASLGDKLVRMFASVQTHWIIPAIIGRKEPFATSLTRSRARIEPGTSGRSRGFKFTLISGLAAYLAEAEKIFVPEAVKDRLAGSRHGKPRLPLTIATIHFHDADGEVFGGAPKDAERLNFPGFGTPRVKLFGNTLTSEPAMPGCHAVLLAQQPGISLDGKLRQCGAARPACCGA